MLNRLHHKSFFLVLGIILIAAFLRLYHLESTPAGFHRDEIISGCVGRYILQNGKDLHGNILPLLYFDKYGDYPPVIPMYISGISTLILGTSTLATRLPVALIGILFLLPIYLLSKLIFGKKEVGLFACFIAAIIPWHVVLSRATSEGVIALTVAGFGLYYLLSSVTKHSTRRFFYSVMLFAFCYLLYPSFRILVPLIYLSVPFIFPLPARLKKIGFISIVLFIILTGFIATTDWGKGRFNQTSVFSTDNMTQITSHTNILSLEDGQGSGKNMQLFHNKGILLSQQVIQQYISYFSPNYIFVQGGLPYRYQVPDVGLLYLTCIPLLFLGLFAAAKNYNRLIIFCFYLLIISPLPSPLTVDDIPNVHRSIFMILPLVLFTGFGWYMIWQNIPKNLKILSIVIPILLLSLEIIFFLHQYFIHSDVIKSILRSDTNKEMVQSVVSKHNNYQSVVMPVHDVLPIFYLFYASNFDSKIAGEFKENMRIDQVDNIKFVDNYCLAKDIKPIGKTLIVEDESCPSGNVYRTLETFSRHDGTRSFRIMESL